MNRWFVYAYPTSYGGLHGMYDWEVITDISYSEACFEGMEMAREVIENYRIFDKDDLMNQFLTEYNMEEKDEINMDDFYDWMEPLIAEECSYEVYPLRPEVDIETVYHDNDEPGNLIKKYCIFDFE